jgi:hypothetical protein
MGTRQPALLEEAIEQIKSGDAKAVIIIDSLD